jgi:hypothetical protein
MGKKAWRMEFGKMDIENAQGGIGKGKVEMEKDK